MTIPYNYPPFKTDSNGNILVSIIGPIIDNDIETGTTAGNTVNFKAYDTNDLSYRTFATLTAGTTPTFNITAPSGGTITITGASVTGLPTPTVGSDAATKTYVDAFISGLTPLTACRVGSTTALTVTYANGTAGVGATLTNAGAQAAISIDGVSLSANDRVLIKDQASTFQNGVYTVTTVGSGATNWVLTRATDFNSSSNITEGSFTTITAGTTNIGQVWLETGSGPFVVGTTAIVFSIFGVLGTMATQNANAVVITGGTINGTVIGGSTPAAATFTTAAATTFTGALTGNASTATALQNARTIGGVSFNGTADIVPQTIQSINESTDTTCFPLFISNSGTQSLQPLNNTSFTFNSNTGGLGVVSLATSAASPLLLTNGQLITVALTSQTVGGATLTIPNFASVSDTFAFVTLAQTLANKTLTAPVISTGLTASGSAANTFAASTGTFITSTGANTLSGAVTVNDATTPSVTLAAGKTNTGFFQVNGKTSGALKIIAADAAAQTVTFNLAAQTVGAGTLNIPDLVNTTKTLAWLESPSFTTPALGVATATSITADTYTLTSTTSTTTNGFVTSGTNAIGIYTASTSRGFISSSGQLLWGSSNSSAVNNANNIFPIFYVSGTTNSTASHAIQRFSNDAVGGRIWYQKGRGALGSVTTVNSGDDLGGINFSGTDGTSRALGASIFSQCDTAPSAGIVPSSLFLATANSSGTLTTALTITSAQAATFAGTVTSGTHTTTGNFALPTSTSSVGNININGVSYLHSGIAPSSFNFFAGPTAGNYTLTATNTIGIGQSAAKNISSGIENVYIGVGAGQFNAIGTKNTGCGSYALDGVTGNSNSSNSAFGWGALTAITTGGSNCAFGESAGLVLTTATDCVLMGKSAGAAITTTGAGGTIAVGSSALAALVNVGACTAVGYQAGIVTTTASHTLIGNKAGTALTTSANGQCFVGSLAGSTATTQVSNTCIGTIAGQYMTGNSNTNVGFGTGLGLVGTPASGDQNTNVGSAAGQQLSSGHDNTFLGYLTGFACTTGSNNVCVGSSAGSGIAANSNNIVINGQGFATNTSAQITIGYGANTGVSVQTKCFIDGIYGVTVAVNTPVFIGTTGQLGSLTISSERYKHSIEDLGADSSAILDLRVIKYLYNDDLDPTQTQQYGLSAEDTAKKMPYLTAFKDGVPEGVRYHELPALLLNELQKLNRRVESLEAALQSKGE